MIKIVYIFPWCKEKDKPCEGCKERCIYKIREGDLKKEE